MANHQQQQQQQLIPSQQNLLVMTALYNRRRQAIQKQQALHAEWDTIVSMSSAISQNAPNKFLFTALRHLTERIHVLRVDVANQKLTEITPAIQVLTLLPVVFHSPASHTKISQMHGIASERAYFAKLLASGKITSLQRTEAWLADTIDKIYSSSSSSSSLIESLEQGTSDTYEALVNMAIVELVAYPLLYRKTGDLAEQLMLPEIFHLDALNLKALSAHFHADVMGAIILQSVAPPFLDGNAIHEIGILRVNHPAFLRAVSSRCFLLSNLSI